MFHFEILICDDDCRQIFSICIGTISKHTVNESAVCGYLPHSTLLRNHVS